MRTLIAFACLKYIGPVEVSFAFICAVFMLLAMAADVKELSK